MNRIVSSIKVERKEKLLLIFGIICVLVFIIGFLIGFFSAPRKDTVNSLNAYYASLVETEDHSYNQKLIDEIDVKNIENHLR